MIKVFTAFVITLTSISLGLKAFAGEGLTTKEAFEKAIQTASNAKNMPIQAIQAFQPEKVIKSYTDHPRETAYTDQTDNLGSLAAQESADNPAAKAIVEGAKSRNDQFSYLKDVTSEATRIYDNSSAMYDAMTGQFSDCAKKTSCVTTYKKEVCEEAPLKTLSHCTQKLDVEMQPKQSVTHYPLTIHINTKQHYYAGATIDAVTGHVDWSGPHDSSFVLEGRIPPQTDCQSLQGTIISVSSQNPETEIDGLSYPSCGNGTKLNIHVTNRNKNGKVNIDIKLDISSTVIHHEPIDRWSGDCAGLSADTFCVLKDEHCLETNTTHKIDGIEVTRPCWQKELSFQCGNSNPLNTCLPLRERGCEQVGSNCKQKENGHCSYYEQTFQCPVKQCTDVGMICNGETYCLDGECVKQQKQPDPDFQRSVSALSAVEGAAKSYTDVNSIFSGQRKTCDKVFLGFINCCADEGWGKDANLAQCSAEEKDLGKAKENLLTIYLGEYCNKDKFGVCVEQRQAYCVFPSVLARVVQAQGRDEQLGIGFGDAEDSDCRGLTREEFSKLNLGKMDFSDFYSEIAKKQHLEQPEELSQRISDNALALQKTGKPYV